MKKILVIKAGDTFPHIIEKHGGFDKWVTGGLSVEPELTEVVNVEKGEELPHPSEVLGAVMTGSHSMVTERLDWSEKTAQWIKSAYEEKTPFLGICYGHQLLADSLGGEAGFHPKGMEIGTVQIDLSKNAKTDPLFKNLPQKFKAHTVHSQTTLRLPEGAVVLASNPHESHHAFRMGECMWGVQFHPEFSSEIMKGYVGEYRDKLADAEGVHSDIAETESAGSILAAFALYCLS